MVLGCSSLRPWRLYRYVSISSLFPQCFIFSLPLPETDFPLITGEFHPCDVGIQRIFKHILRQAASEFFIKQVEDAIADGTASEDVRISTSFPLLRDQTPAWLRKAVEHFNVHNPGLVLKAWEKSPVGDTSGFNLSYESLTSAGVLTSLMEKDER